MHINGIKRKEYTNVSQQFEIYTYFLMNKQYVEGVQNGKKAYLMRKRKIAMWLYNSLAGFKIISFLF